MSMVIDNVYNHSHSSLVALVDELLVHFSCTIGFLKCEECYRVITPAVRTVELMDRHKLHSIHSQCLDIVELLHCTLDVTCSSEVTEMKLIYHKVILILDLIVCHGPCIIGLLHLESGYRALGCSRIVWKTRVSRACYISVIWLIYDL